MQTKHTMGYVCIHISILHTHRSDANKPCKKFIPPILNSTTTATTSYELSHTVTAEPSLDDSFGEFDFTRQFLGDEDVYDDMIEMIDEQHEDFADMMIGVHEDIKDLDMDDPFFPHKGVPFAWFDVVNSVGLYA